MIKMSFYNGKREFPGRMWPMIEEAIRFATRAHEGQFRKGTNKPYIVHPLEVGEILSEITEDEEIIAAGILHDTIEDCANVTADILRKQFGERVATLVLHESEDKTKSWKERKSTTIEKLKTAPLEVKYIGLADKLSNIRDIDRDYPIYKEELWKRFRMKDKNIIGWYYKGIREALRDLRELPAYKEYCRLVDKNFS